MGSLSKKSAFLRFFGIFTANFGGKSPKFWYLFDFYRVFLNNFGSQPCGVVFWVKWGLNLEKWPFLGIFQPCLKCYRRLKFLIREVNFHNLLTLYLYFMFKKESVAKNSEKMKNSSFFVKSPFFHFGTSGGHFELKLGKHAYFVIFSIISEFGEFFKKLKNFRFRPRFA